MVAANIIKLGLIFGSLGSVFAASYNHFGLLDAFGITGAVCLLMPWEPRRG